MMWKQTTPKSQWLKTMKALFLAPLYGGEIYTPSLSHSGTQADRASSISNVSVTVAEMKHSEVHTIS